MKSITSLFLTGSFLFAAEVAPVPEGPLSPADKTLNALKDGEWISLFDGKTLAGWKGEGYEVKDGAIWCTPKGAFLHTEKEFGDFVLDFEFKLEPGTNNGIGLRYPGTGDAAYTGMEIQVLDDGHEKYKDLKTWQYHGSVYNLMPSIQSKKNHLKPCGEWNHETIVCIGQHVKVILNGETITDCYLDKIEFDKAKHPGALRKSGFIAFCGHGDPVAYRNVRVMDFTAAPPMPKTSADNTAPPGFKALFNGKDLTGWNGMIADGNPFKRQAMSAEERAKAQEEANKKAFQHWKVEGGAIVYDGKAGQNLCTDKPYGDFELYVDWKIPATADSGLYLRSTPQVQIWDPANPAQFQHGNQKGSGGLWNNNTYGKGGKDPLVKGDNPIGEWNTFHIRMIDDKVTIHLNGKLIIDNQPLEAYWDKGTKALPREELFELQDHGNNLWFKNIYIREIPW